MCVSRPSAQVIQTYYRPSFDNINHVRRRIIGALLGRLLAFQPDTAALARTTAAMTVLSAGTAQNVLPQTGNLTINFRHLPGALQWSDCA